MTRRDFVLISETMKEHRPDETAQASFARGRFEAWEEIVEAFARKLRSTNPNFDAGRFKRACGLEE